MYPLICDSGTGYLKIGYSNYSHPQFNIPAIVGKPILRTGEKIGDIQLKVKM